MLTAKQVQTDVIELLHNSLLEQEITGKIYRGTPDGSYRPRGSQKEDIIVIFTQGTSDQIEQGTVTLNIYCPDVPLGMDNQTLAENGSRTQLLEHYASQWVDSLIDIPTPYKFTLQQTIWTERDASINQHFVVVKLNYKYYNGNK